MRRALAAAVLGLSLWIGSLAWSGFVMTRTVLDPGRSEAVAEALLENDAVRDQLVANIASGIETTLPPGAPVDRPTIEAAARTALESPQVEALFLDAFVRTHQAFLGEGEPPKSIDGGAFGAAARDALVQSRPELDGILPPAPSVPVPLPTERIPNLGGVRSFLLTAIPALAGVAALGALLALMVASNRPAVIRRAGIWAIGLSAIVLIFAYGIPAAAEAWAPAQAEIVAALIGALASSTRGPALGLAGAGVAGLLLSLVWKAAPSMIGTDGEPIGRTVGRGGRQVRATPPRVGRQDLPRGYRAPAPRGAAAPAPALSPSRAPDGPGRRRPPVVDPTQGYSDLRPGTSAPADLTRVQAAAADASSGHRMPPADVPGARWVDGVGWVHDGTGEIPPTARWVPGVGYVLGPD